MNRPIRLANTFHEIARPFRSGLGFELQNEPNQFGGAYLATRAVYKSRDGFFLAVGFEPLDGSDAGLMCGRSWNYTSDIPELRRFERLSNKYHVLAKRFGFDLPERYKLDVDDAANSDIQAILDDLKATLPDILSRVTLEDLVAIEQEKDGSQWHQERESRQRTLKSIGSLCATSLSSKNRSTTIQRLLRRACFRSC